MIDSKIAVYHRNLCELYRQLGQLDKAVSHGLRAVKLEPTAAAGHSNLGVAYYDLKKLDQAETCQKRALTLDRNCAVALNAMGSLQRERRDMAQAVDFYRRAVAADEHYAEALNNLGALLVLEGSFDEALPLLTRALQLTPNYSDPHCNLGFVLNGLERYSEAFPHFQLALQLRPNYAEAYLGLAEVYRKQLLLPQAESVARQGVALLPGKAEAHSILAAVLAESGATQHALAEFDRALTIDPTLHSALVGKGNLCMEMGDLKLAEALLTQALKGEASKRQLAVRYHLSQLRKVQADDPNLIALATETELDSLPEREQRYVHFALGKSYDDAGAYDLAMTHFMQGCALKRKAVQYDATQQAQTFDDTIKLFSETNLRRWRGVGNDSALPIFVLGMPRSGTTLVEQIIASHPQVFGAGELPDLLQMLNRSPDGHTRFPECMQDISKEQIGAWGAEYVAGLRQRHPDARFITDKMPSNFFALGLIHVMLPNAKIIHVRRDPVDTCLSCFTRLFSHGQEYSYDLAELGQYYTGYEKLTQHWRKVLPAGAFMEVRYEDIVADMETHARRLIAFCGLEWDAACHDFYNTKRAIRTASVTQVRQPIYNSSVGRWHRYEKHLKPLLQALGNLAGK
jgi:tetratricopeptide (TPR) repeat protein